MSCQRAVMSPPRGYPDLRLGPFGRFPGAGLQLHPARADPAKAPAGPRFMFHVFMVHVFTSNPRPPSPFLGRKPTQNAAIIKPQNAQNSGRW